MATFVWTVTRSMMSGVAIQGSRPPWNITAVMESCWRPLKNARSIRPCRWLISVTLTPPIEYFFLLNSPAMVRCSYGDRDDVLRGLWRCVGLKDCGFGLVETCRRKLSLRRLCDWRPASPRAPKRRLTLSNSPRRPWWKCTLRDRNSIMPKTIHFLIINFYIFSFSRIQLIGMKLLDWNFIKSWILYVQWQFNSLTVWLIDGLI